jgi:hypothetical protein
MFIWDHGFRSFSPQLLDPVPFQPEMRQYIGVEICGGEKLLTSW